MTNFEINLRISEGIHRPDVDDLYVGPPLSEAAGLLKVDLLVKTWNSMNDTELEAVTLA